MTTTIPGEPASKNGSAPTPPSAANQGAGRGGVPGADLSFLHLQVEMLRLDLQIHRAVQLWQEAQRAEGERGDVFSGQYISDTEIAALLRRPLGANWWSGTGVTMGTDHAEIAAQAARRAAGLRETAKRQGSMLRLDRLAAGFGLRRDEMDALLICLAPALDRRYERFYGYLQDDATRRWPSVNLILDLLYKPGPERLLRLANFDPDAPLMRYGLLRRVPEPGITDPPVLNQALRPDETVVSWLLGRYRAHTELHAHVTVVEPRDAEVDETVAWVPDETLAALLHVVERASSEWPVLAFHGRDAESQWAAARFLGGRLGTPLLRVSLQSLIQGRTTPGPSAGEASQVVTQVMAPQRALRLVLRDARLCGAIPFLGDWDVVLKDGAPPPDVLREVSDHPGPVILAGKERWLPQGAERENRLHWLEFGTPTFVQRRRLWQHLLGSEAGEAQPEPPKKRGKGAKGESTKGGVAIDGVAGQFVLTTGQIRDSVILARDMVSQRGEALAERDLFAAARAHASPTLAKLARQIEPRYAWDDIILPADQVAMLRELVATVRSRPQVLEEWGVGKKLASSAGVTVLFSGPPGTGKTMSAEVIAGELGLDLYKIDLSTVVSKYIGETEKNLEQIFREAETSNAILFFDEADAIFGKRSEVRDAHDRYANIEISYLLQRMESYDGVTILATNLRSNLDAAFTRRLQFVVDIPFPEEEDRLRIWRALLPPGVPCSPDVDLPALANRFKLAGGNIRNVIVSAAYLAASDGGMITHEYLLHGMKRELQKMGRLMKDGELAGR